MGENSVKRLGIDIDFKFSFKNHVHCFRAKASRKLIASPRLVMKVFIQCQFNYSPLVWLFHSLKLHNTIKLHARSLRIVYNDNKSTFEELLSKDNSVSIHHKNIQKLAKEIYKAKNNFFTANHPRHISNNEYPSQYEDKTKKQLWCGIHKIWNILPKSYKEADTLNKFELYIIHWISSNCPFKLCKHYIQNVGFID